MSGSTAAPVLIHPQADDASSRPIRSSAPALWFCIHLPGLALQACGLDAAVPCVVLESIKGRSLVHSASAAAQAAGIQAGMRLAQALALCEGLQARARRPRDERNALRRLAVRLSRFTPMVSITPPRALLLEVRASLRLFGGLAKLQEQLEADLAALGFDAVIAAAPTPLASLWLARRGQTRVLTDTTALRSVLGQLSVADLPLAPELTKRLKKLGVREVRDLWRLPRDGLAGRFGPDLLREMDQALGHKADPRPAFSPAERFSAALELPWAVADTAALLTAAGRLVSGLCRFLRARDAGVNRLWLELHHVGRPASRLRVGLRLDTRDDRHLLRLIEEHLDRLSLPAPVVGLGLATGPIRPLAATPLSLFSPATDRPSTDRGGKAEDEHDWQALLDQLEVRLGVNALRRLWTHPDHRPESAWASAAPGAPADRFAHAERPLWLLAKPRPLRVHDRLHTVSGPERIESGWWDGGDLRRDYYVVKDGVVTDGVVTDGARRLWVFRNLESGAWYLHGLFA